MFHEQKLNNSEEQLKKLESLVDQSFLQNEDLSVWLESEEELNGKENEVKEKLDSKQNTPFHHESC